MNWWSKFGRRLSLFSLLGLLLLPLMVIYNSWWQLDLSLWQHLSQTVLSEYLQNSLLLAFGVGIGTLLLGTSLAALVAFCQFPGRGLLQWLLLLPLAMPAYIIAYTYTGLLDFAGPIQSQLRELMGWRIGDYYFPQVRSLTGAILLLTLVLYPYVYLLARTAFAGQSKRLLEASLSLGLSRFAHARLVALPMARPAVVTGVALAMMEAFADYGTVQYFGIPTLTTGIFRTWFGLGQQAGAAQLSSLLCTLVIVLIYLEFTARRSLRYFYSGQQQTPSPQRKLTGLSAWGATLFAATVVAMGFALPALTLLSWSLQEVNLWWSLDYLNLLRNSMSLAAMAALLVVAIALVLAYALRLWPNPLMQLVIRLSSMGYALPGTVIAIGVMMPLAWFDNRLDLWLEQQFGIRSGLLFSGTVVALLFAYTVRFLAVALQGVDAGLGQIKPSMDQAARSLGLNRSQVLWQIHRPLLRNSLLCALLLVFVDVLKELPATLLLRPFNFDTLAVRTFELASDEQLAAAAVPALTIVLIGLLPVYLLARSLDKPSAVGTNHSC